MAIDITLSALFQAATWLQENAHARMTSKSKVAHLLLTYGGSYDPGDPEKLRIAGVAVSTTCGTGNLLAAWRSKAEAKLNAATAKAGA